MQWASSFDACCFLDSNNFKDPYSSFDVLIAAGVKTELVASAGNAFGALAQFRKENPGWISGFFGYDLKNETEDLTSGNLDQLGFPDLYFFVPQHLIIIKGNEVEFITDDPQGIVKAIGQQVFPNENGIFSLTIQSRFSRESYLTTFKEIREHIQRGDIYVTNFCQEFFVENAFINPAEFFLKLNEISPNPFASFFKWREKYILCASPERFLAKRGDKLIAQPIKGTAKRSDDPFEDQKTKQRLKDESKEQQENVMVVDLVRNDLTTSAKKGSVKTEELFGIYSFEHLHHMISTVTCELANDVTPVQAIKNSFPMGSMTGAPKLSSMRLMEQYELSKRGVYSGAIGYFNPDDDFDFSVVIRAVLYNSKSRYLSFQTGSAITWQADAEKEYEECLLKAKAIVEVLENLPES